MKIDKTLVWCAAGFAQIVFVRVKLLKTVDLSQIVFKTEKQCAFHEKQNALFRSCAARFGQIAFLSVKVVKIVTLAWNALQNGKTVRFSWKLYKTLVSRHAQHVLAKSHFWASKLSKCLTGLKFSPKRENSGHELCSFHVMRSTFWKHLWASFQNVTLALNSLQNGERVRFSWKVYKTLFSGAQHVLAKSHFWPSKLSKSSHWPGILFKTGKQCAFHKNVQNALFRWCAARFGQNAFLSVKVVKVVTLAWNSLLNVKTVRFSWKLYETLVSGHAQHVLAKSHFWASKLSKSSHWPEELVKTWKKCAFYETCTTIACFRSCAGGFAQIAFVRVKLLEIARLVSNSLQNGKTVRFSWKL